MSTRQTWALLARRTRAVRDLVEKVEIWRPSRASDGMGGMDETYARVATVPGRVESVDERAVLLAERMGAVASAVILLPFDVTPAPGDELRVGSAHYAFIGSDAGLTANTTTRAVVGEAR